jgi:hypothetical protein
MSTPGMTGSVSLNERGMNLLERSALNKLQLVSSSRLDIE